MKGVVDGVFYVILGAIVFVGAAVVVWSGGWGTLARMVVLFAIYAALRAAHRKHAAWRRYKRLFQESSDA